jgi:hypothetical protein
LFLSLNNINSTSTKAHFVCHFLHGLSILEPHVGIDQQRYNLLQQTNPFVSHSQATSDISIVPRISPGMDDTERRTVKRSRFDQTEPEPRKASRFDRRSRSPPSRRSESGRDRSPIAKDETPEIKKSPTDAAAAAGMYMFMFLALF